MSRKTPTPDPAAEAYYARSKENMRNEARMIEDMEAGGCKVVRRDTWDCRAVLITPEVVHLETTGEHGYYPNAVAELYEMWKARGKEQVCSG